MLTVARFERKKRQVWTRVSKPSFTLVELLVAVSIIGVLASMVLFSLAGAQRDALTIRTQGTIKKINDIILAKWEEYRYRSVRLNIPGDLLVPARTPAGDLQVPLSPREGARARMLGLRDLMRMEMPDRYTDLLYTPIQFKIGLLTADNYGASPESGNDRLMPFPDRDVPGQFLAMRRTMVVDPIAAANSLQRSPYDGTLPVAAVGTLRPSVQHQSAELLYEIVANSTYMGGSALEFFSPSEIGDTDGDGFREFLDAWGRPIYWLRWPAGSPSPLNDTTIPDPMDPIKTDWRWGGSGLRPWMLVPLIVSAGPDGEFDTVFDFSGTTPVVNPTGLGSVVYALNEWTGNTDPGGANIQRSLGRYYFPNPYLTIGGVGLGAVMDLNGDGVDNAADNITNYELVLQ